jgi:hypothetical protein
LFGRKLPPYADFGGWVISTIGGWFVVTADRDERIRTFQMLRRDLIVGNMDVK